MRNSIFLAFMVSLLVLVSCEKEKDFDKDKVCFKDIVYPFSIQFEDESTMTINTEEEYKNAFSLCDEETEEDVDVVKDEEENEIDWSEDEYDDKPEYIACGFGDCEKEEKDACFDFIYPITVSFSDGSTKSIANEEELWKAKMACKKGKHDYDDK